VGLTALTLLAGEALRGIAGWVRTVQSEQIQDHIHGLIHEKALADFSLAIPRGRIVALVGQNGSGKSTLIKLACRFHDPDRGRILLDGVDLRGLNLSELWRRITVLFQEPVRYHETVADNIAFGDLAAAPDTEEIETAARAAGAGGHIQRLPQGYKTVLGKWFGGAELSVGEWQRWPWPGLSCAVHPLLSSLSSTNLQAPWIPGPRRTG